ncbi:hypothetical protein FQR65_LT19183 [Abscondita terminalis]|nr:hypothetical protein FQR65_LT19183 [Abscondita terminalis]
MCCVILRLLILCRLSTTIVHVPATITTLLVISCDILNHPVVLSWMQRFLAGLELKPTNHTIQDSLTSSSQGEVVLDDVQSVEDTVPEYSQMFGITDQKRSSEMRPSRSLLSPKIKFHPNNLKRENQNENVLLHCLASRRSKRLASVDTSVGVLQLPEECCNTALQDGAGTHREPPQEQVELNFAHDGKLAQTVSKVWAESQKAGCSKDPIYYSHTCCGR